ncbi:immunoglobulin-like domain-containing protein [Listeria booriae]|uniref:immunoglobulin-like domain-containing protein n=1 Tax=Listeria booriae TaxID=1552123 RepID=UPI001626A4FE|nr:immunoglobulin-like domain-containing protein [Listeria booriae]
MKSLFKIMLIILVVASQMQISIPNAKAVSKNTPSQANTLADAVKVNTFAELKAALNDATVEHITIEADIAFSEDIQLNWRNVTINGNADKGVIIDAKQYTIRAKQVYTDNNRTLKIENMKALGMRAADFKFIDASRGWDVAFHNIDYNGSKLVKASNGTVNFDGQNKVKTLYENADVRHLVFKENSQYNGIAADGAKRAAFDFDGDYVDGKAIGKVRVESGADVSIVIAPQDTAGLYYFPAFDGKVYDINVAESAALKIDASGTALSFAARGAYYSTPIVNVRKDAKVEFTSRGGGEYPAINLEEASVINIHPGATFAATGNSMKGVITSVDGSRITLDNPKAYEIKNKKSHSPLFYDTKNTLFAIKEASVMTWTKTGGEYDREADNSWEKNTTTTTIEGSSSKNTESTDVDLEASFQMFQYGKISGVGKASSNEKPVINAEDRTIKVGDTLDPREGVTAHDAEDGDLTKDIQVVRNEVNPNVPGVYEVEYSVTDSDGNTTTKTIKVTVKSNEKPVINAEDKTIQVGDTFDPKEGVTAHDAEDGDLTKDIKILKNEVNPNVPGVYEVEYSVTDSDGNTTTKTIKVTVIPKEEYLLTADEYGLFDDYITGTNSANIKKVQLVVDGVVKNATVTNSESYSIWAAEFITDANQKVEIYGLDASGKVVAKTDVIIKKIETKLTANDYDFDRHDEYITGTHSQDIVKVKVFVNGRDRMTASTNNAGRGNYKIYARQYITNFTDDVVIKGLDRKGNVIAEVKVKIVKSQTQLTASDFIMTLDESITGTASSDVKQVKLKVNGKIVNQIKTKDGQYSLYAQGLITSEDDVVMVCGYNEEGVLIKEVPVNVKYIMDGAEITANPYEIGEELITGTATGGAHKVNLVVNGKTVNHAFVQNGKYTVYARDFITNSTDKVEVVSFSKLGFEIKRAVVTITK